MKKDKKDNTKTNEKLFEKLPESTKIEVDRMRRCFLILLGLIKDQSEDEKEKECLDTIHTFFRDFLREDLFELYRNIEIMCSDKEKIKYFNFKSVDGFFKWMFFDKNDISGDIYSKMRGLFSKNNFEKGMKEIFD